MPIVKPGDALLSGFSLSTPPTLPKLFGPVWGGAGQVPGWAASAWAQANYGQWSQLSGHVVAHLGATVGIPRWALEGFSTFFANLPLVPASQLLSTALGKAAALVSDALADASTAIPILGWVVKLGLGIYDTVQYLIASSKETPRPAGEALVFRPEDNEAQALAIIGAAREADWNLLFLPPSTSGRWSARHVTWTPGGAGEGWAIGTGNDLGAGLLPGMAECLGTLVTDAGFTTYQFPNRSSGLAFGSEFDIPPLATAGQLTPSSRQLAVLLWQSVMKSGIPQFRLDPQRIELAWSDYFEGLVEFADDLEDEGTVKNVQRGNAWERGLNPKLAYNECRIAASYLNFTGQENGDVKLISPANTDGFDTSKRLERAGASLDELAADGPLSYTYADIVRHVCRILHRRQLASLKTITVAYVPPDAPALVNGSDRQLWHDMRSLLLRNRAVVDVELELIPDAEYRAEVSQAQRTRSIVADVGFGAVGADGSPPKKGHAPGLDGVPMDDPPGSPPPGIPGTPTGGSRGSGALVPAVAAGLGLAAAALLLRRRR